METAVSTWRLFEELVRRILEENGFDVQVHSPRGDIGFDLDAKKANDRWAIEVKYYRTARAQPTLIEAAANRLIANGLFGRYTKGMLIVSCLLSPSMRSAFEEKFSITFVDRVDLRNLASNMPTLVEELDSILEASPTEATEDPSNRRDPLSGSRTLSPNRPIAIEDRGHRLCRELRSLKAGKKAWAAYEHLCERILRYLFPNDLQGWHKQKRTDDGLNRFDFVCRVKPTTDFWNFLISHLNSRYVMFEFKNYAAGIKQGQILTTEKYLLERGLRRAAIIFTRLGAKEDATKMAQGAMREHGKLLLVLDDEKVCEMLHMKDRGLDPTDCLFEVADEFLMSLPR